MIELYISTNKDPEELTVEDLCQLRDEIDRFMYELATGVINNKTND